MRQQCSSTRSAAGRSVDCSGCTRPRSVGSRCWTVIPRGRLAMDDLEMIGEMSGVAVLDDSKPYRHYDVDHGL